MTINARITFADEATPETFTFHSTASVPSKFNGRVWRFLADDTAIILVPLCDSLARPVTELPLVDRMEIQPCRWGYPDFSQTHAKEVEQLKRRFLGGEFPPGEGRLLPPDHREQQWPAFLEQIGNAMLWKQCATVEMRRHWLNEQWPTYPEQTGNAMLWKQCTTKEMKQQLLKEHSAGFALSMFAQRHYALPRTAEPTITLDDLHRIRFRADFYHSESRQTIYLRDCATAPLTDLERCNSPAHLARLEKLEAAKAQNIAKGAAVAKQLTAAADKARKEGAARKKATEAKKTFPWHSDGFDHLFRRNLKGEMKDRHPLTPEFRAVVQLLNETAGQTARFCKIEPQIGGRIRQIELSDGRDEKEASPSGKRRLRDMLKTQEGRKLKTWGVLVVERVGRQKFLRLAPPTPLK